MPRTAEGGSGRRTLKGYVARVRIHARELAGSEIRKLAQSVDARLADAEPELKDYAKEKPEIVARLTKLHEEWARDVTPKK